MSYEDIIGGQYDIIGNCGDFNGQFNQQGGPVPNWGPVPGYGPTIGPYGLAIGAEGDPAAAYGPMGPAPMGYTCPMPQPMPTPATAGLLAGPDGSMVAPPGFPGGGFPGAFGPWGGGFGPWGYGGYGGPVVPNGNAVASLVAAKNSLLVQPRLPARARNEFLGFPRVCLGPCETATIVTQPQVLAKIFKIVIPSDIAFQLLIHDIKVGKWSMMANGEPIPAAMLSELVDWNTDLNPDTAQVSTNISVTVQNISNAEVDFRMGALVKAIE